MKFLQNILKRKAQEEITKLTEKAIREKLGLQSQQDYLFEVVVNPDLNKPKGLTTDKAIATIQEAVNNKPKYEGIYIPTTDSSLQEKVVTFSEQIGVTIPPIVNTISRDDKGKYLIVVDR